MTRTGANYQLGSTGLTNIGFYRVVIANSQGTDTSGTILLSHLDRLHRVGLITSSGAKD